MIIVDTSVLSLAFRRKKRDLNPGELTAVYGLDDLLKRGEAVIIGLIRQELLSGIANPTQFERLSNRLSVLDDLPLNTETFVLSARFFNRCRRAGIAPGDIDMAICAVASLRGLRIFTMDPDFVKYERQLPISLYPY